MSEQKSLLVLLKLAAGGSASHWTLLRVMFTFSMDTVESLKHVYVVFNFAMMSKDLAVLNKSGGIQNSQ